MPTTHYLHTLADTLAPRPPCDFAKTLGFLGAFSPTEGEQALTDKTLTKAITLHGRAVAFELSSAADSEHPAITYTLFSEQPFTAEEHTAIIDRMRFFLSLDDDLQPFYRLGSADPQFAPVIERLYGLRQPKFLTPFEIACWAMLCQRVPMSLAHKTKFALVERWGTSITLDGKIYRAFPEPQQLARVDPNDLAAVVRNTRKVEYLRAVIEFFQDVDEDWLRNGNFDEVATRLRAVRGIGEWSAHFILVRGLGRMERVSSIDKELLKAAASIYNAGQPVTPADMQRILDHYGAAQGYWAFYARIATLALIPPPSA